MLVFIFDQSSYNKAFSDVVNVSRMNVCPGGKQLCLRDAVWAGRIQRMVDNNGIPREMKAVLEGHAINCNQNLSNRVKNNNLYHTTYLLCIIHYILNCKA